MLSAEGGGQLNYVKQIERGRHPAERENSESRRALELKSDLKISIRSQNQYIGTQNQHWNLKSANVSLTEFDSKFKLEMLALIKTFCGNSISTLCRVIFHLKM